MMRVSEVAPPVVRLGQAVGWDPLPLSVRDARRRSVDLRARLDGRSRDAVRRRSLRGCVASATGGGALRRRGRRRRRRSRSARRPGVGVDGPQRIGQDVAAVGAAGVRSSSERNGCRSPATRPTRRGLLPARSQTRIGLVPQSPGDLLYLSTVAAECALADSRERTATRGMPRAARPDRAGHRRRCPSSRPVGGAAIGVGPRSATVLASGRRDARRAHTRTRRGRQDPIRRGHQGARERGPGGRRGDARRGVRGQRRRSRRGARRWRGRRRRADGRRCRGVADLRPAGRQGDAPGALADGRQITRAIAAEGVR